MDSEDADEQNSQEEQPKNVRYGKPPKPEADAETIVQWIEITTNRTTDRQLSCAFYEAGNEIDYLWRMIYYA